MKLQGDKLGRKGYLSVSTEVFEVTPSLFMVELQKDSGDTLEYNHVRVNYCNYCNYFSFVGPVQGILTRMLVQFLGNISFLILLVLYMIISLAVVVFFNCSMLNLCFWSCCCSSTKIFRKVSKTLFGKQNLWRVIPLL